MSNSKSGYFFEDDIYALNFNFWVKNLVAVLFKDNL